MRCGTFIQVRSPQKCQYVTGIAAMDSWGSFDKKNSRNMVVEIRRCEIVLFLEALVSTSVSIVSMKNV